ncbi:MAG: hypothetical protein JAY68_19485 [Candidatus Thiodiazotropha taylori]|nr:hypothetical protein [Candidatus Thiodiazotropha taylori]
MKSEVTSFEQLLAGFMGLVVVVFTAYSQFMISGFLELFSETQTELPHSTQLVFATYRWWLLLAIGAMLGMYQVVLRKRRVGWWPIVTSLILVGVLLPITVWSMYAPITN